MASLKELQQALALRLTQGIEHAASDGQHSLLGDFQAEELRHSRETLVRKRISQLGGLMPNTQLALGSEFTLLCRAFIDQHHFDGYLAPQLDAIHFARWLAHQPAPLPWQIETAAWESLRVEWFSRRWLLRVKRFRYRIQHEMRAGTEATPGRSLWIALRLGGWGRLQRLL